MINKYTLFFLLFSIFTFTNLNAKPHDITPDPSGNIAIDKNDPKYLILKNRIGVNAYIWASSLKILQNMPLAHIDPISGVIYTDWYKMNKSSKTEYKVYVYVMEDTLIPDALNVKVFTRVNKGSIVKSSRNLDKQIEDNILFLAREMRVHNK